MLKKSLEIADVNRVVNCISNRSFLEVETVVKLIAADKCLIKRNNGVKYESIALKFPFRDLYTKVIGVICLSEVPIQLTDTITESW